MQTSKLSTLLEVATGIAVLVGLLFVVQELKQNNQYAQAESTRDLFQMWSDVYEFAAENKIDQLRKKATDNPSELSDNDLIALDTFYWKMMNAE